MRPDRRVAFLARDLVWEDTSGGSLPFSYAARKLDASLRSAPDLSDVEATTIDLRSSDPEAFFESIRAFRPTLVAASTYIWSVKVFCQVAELVRRWEPSIRFVMGGPAARPSVLSLPPYAPFTKHLDAVAPGEGEELVRRLVREHLKTDWQRTVPGLTVPHPLGWRKTEALERIALDDYASPYQLAPVPKADIGFLETFRGCPISCAFCQWGEERSDRVHSAGYLTSHLRGFTEGAVERVYVLDAGFNLSARAFRNLAAAECEVGALRKMQVIGHIYPAFIREEHLALFESFGRAELSVGVQSFDKEVLKKLGRPFDLARFEQVLGELSGRFPLDLEIILGLPGDNPASFRRTFEKAIARGTKVRVFFCLVLPDALLDRATEFDIDFDPETFELRSCRGWTAESLRAEWEHVCKVAATMHRPVIGPNWAEFRTEPTAGTTQQPSHNTSGVASEGIGRLRDAIALAKMGWQLVDARLEGEGLIVDLDGASGRLVLEVGLARPGHRRFIEHEGIAYSYRGQMAPAGASRLRSFIGLVHHDVRLFLLSLGATTPRPVAEERAAPSAKAAPTTSAAEPRAVRELFERGYTVFECAYSTAEVDYLRERLTGVYDRIGRPKLSANPPYQPQPDVEVGPPGIVFHKLTTHFPDIAARLYKRHIIDTIRAVLGDDMQLEVPAGALSDSSRPFFEWHMHIDGANNAYQDGERVYRRFERSERVTVLHYLDDLTEDNGRLLVYPRKLTDPTEPPYDINLQTWPGQVEIGCQRGSVVVLEQCTWHAALQKRSPGLRGFIGSYFAARSAKTSPLSDNSLRNWSGDDELFRSILPRP